MAFRGCKRKMVRGGSEGGAREAARLDKGAE